MRVGVHIVGILVLCASLFLSGCLLRGPSRAERIQAAGQSYNQQAASLSKQGKQQLVLKNLYSGDAAVALNAVYEVRKLFSQEETIAILKKISYETTFSDVEEVALKEMSYIDSYDAKKMLIDYVVKYKDNSKRRRSYWNALSALKKTNVLPLTIKVNSNQRQFINIYTEESSSFFRVVDTEPSAVLQVVFSKFNLRSWSYEVPVSYRTETTNFGYKDEHGITRRHTKRVKSGGYTEHNTTGEFSGVYTLETASGEKVYNKSFSFEKTDDDSSDVIEALIEVIDDDLESVITPQLAKFYPNKLMAPEERERRITEAQHKQEKARQAERTVKLSLRSRGGKYERRPLAQIERIVSKREKAYAELADQVFPAEVTKPSLPPSLKLVQGKYEADLVFADRVKSAQRKRQHQIDSIQRQYKQQISARNKQVEELQNIQKQRLKELPDKREMFIAEAVKDVFKGVFVDNAYYNRKTAVLSLDVHASSAAYIQKVGASLLDPNVVESIAEHPKSAKWIAFFRGAGDGFVLDRVECSVNGKNIIFNEMKEETVLAEGKPQSVTIAQADGSGLNSIASLQKQAPDLADYNNTVTLKFNDGRVVRVTGDTELARKVTALAATKGSPNHYLLAIGIESYKAAAAVPFAENSVKIISQLLAKKYGILERNQVVLFGNAATGQAIQGHLRNLTARMGKDDTLFFYYAGHGLAGKDGREVYMIPSDVVRGAYVDEDFAFSKIINDHFAKMGQVYAFLDTCFSGRASTQTMITEGVAPVYKTSAYNLPPNVTVFFAGKGDQYANYYPEKGHRLFSYYVARAILDGKTSIPEMDTYVRNAVKRTSAQMGADHLQEPFVGGNSKRLLGQ